jgi:hypothetical protein
MFFPKADRIGDPAIDGGFVPARAVDADLDLRRERALGHLAIERRAGEAGAGEHGLDPDDFVIGIHGDVLPFCDSQWRPKGQTLAIAIRRARAFPVNLRAG